MSTENRTDLPTLLPCLHLFRASGLAVDPKKMLVGGLALCVLLTGDGLISQLPFAPESAASTSGFRADYLRLPWNLGTVTAVDSPWPARCLTTGLALLLTPIRSVLEPGLDILRSGTPWSELAWAWTRMLWAILVWSMAGGAIARMSALQFAQKKRISLAQSVRFAGQQYLSYLTAPFLPLAGVLCLLGFMAFDSWLLSLIPVAGDYVIGLFWIVALFLGFLMAMMLTGFAAGWPLMIAAVSTEDSDGFDGLSRSIGFWFDRPWYAVFLIALAVPIFVAGWILVSFLIGTVVYLAAWSVASTTGDSGPAVFEAAISTPLLDESWWNGWLYRSEIDGPSLDTVPSAFVIAWTHVPALLLAGFGPSYFWSAVTVIYFLLRESDDGTALTDVVDWRDRAATPEKTVEKPASSESAPAEPASEATQS